MDLKLKQILQRDTLVIPYEEEEEQIFVSRLIYVAISAWIRNYIFDNTEKCKSKAYLKIKGTEILNNFLEVFPECRNYFWKEYEKDNNEAIHPINLIRQRMLSAGELIELQENNKITMPPSKCVSLTDEWCRVIDTKNHLRKLYCVGVIRICENKTDTRFELEERKSSEEYLKWISNQAKWAEIERETTFEVFTNNCFSVPSKSWTNNMPRNDGTYLARTHGFNGQSLHYLLRIENGCGMTYKLPEFFEEYREYRRIILALRKKSGFPLKSYVEKKDAYILLRLTCGLPIQEEQLIESYSWPKNTIVDKMNYIVPIELWSLTKCKLVNLGMEVKGM